MYYVAFYNQKSITAEEYAISPAARKKVEYIAEVLAKKQNIQILSPAWSKSKRRIKYKATIKKIGDNLSIHQFSTFGIATRIGRVCQWVYSLGQLILYLLKNIQKNETIIVYHSLYLILPVLIVKKIKKIKYVLEVEERYQDILRLPNILSKLENIMIENADKYIFAAKTLNDACNNSKKQMCVINGAYIVEPIVSDKFNDGLIHCVYSGTFDEKKGGAYLTAEAAEYLPETFCVHICGFGTSEQVKKIQETICSVQKKSVCKLKYEGMLADDDYIRFIQKCHIGINAQTPNDKFSNTCFPSKILVYLSNGLAVVSSSNEAVTNSDIAQFLSFYDSQDPADLAKAILTTDISRDGRDFIYNLDKRTTEYLANMLNT